MSFIPYGHQHIEQADIDAVIEALKSDWLTQGPSVNSFEERLSAYCGAKHAVAVCNATAALHLAYLALGLGPGDTLWTSPNTFVATANAALHCGAKVDFVDIDEKTYNLCPLALADKLKKAATLNQLPKIVVPVHFAGQSCDMHAIKILADQYGFRIVEHAKKMQALRSHGVIRDEMHMSEQSHCAWYYQQIYLGFNYRITDMQCALGLSQLQRIEQLVQRRNALAERYHDSLATLPFILPTVLPENYSAYHLYIIQVNPRQTDVTRKILFDHLRAANIGVNVHYIPIHLQPYYHQFGFRKGNFPIAETYYQHTITLPLYYGLSESMQDFIVQQLKLGVTHESACYSTS